MPVRVPAGALLEIGRATRGVRSYLAVAGGIAVEPVLGSRSTDTLSNLGPPRLTNGMTLPIGTKAEESATVGLAVQSFVECAGPNELRLGVWLGPRDDWFVAGELFDSAYQISPVSNRVEARLIGARLRRTRADELAPEPVVLGAIQLPADGQPLIFLADHPTTSVRTLNEVDVIGRRLVKHKQIPAVGELLAALSLDCVS